MTTREKKEMIDNSPVLGYWSNLGGVEVRKIEETPDGIKFWIKANAWGNNPTYHIRRVIAQYTIDKEHRDNIRVYNRRLYLKDCIKYRR